MMVQLNILGKTIFLPNVMRQSIFFFHFVSRFSTNMNCEYVNIYTLSKLNNDQKYLYYILLIIFENTSFRCILLFIVGVFYFGRENFKCMHRICKIISFILV